MNELDKTFGHYYGTFEHIDTVKLRIFLNFKIQEMDFLEIKVDGDTCVVDGKKTLSLENVSEFANNSIFQELKAELNEVEAKYFNLKAKYEKGECSHSEEREYIEIATKRQNLIDSIEEIQKNIFNMSLRMCQDEARGEVTTRQKEAYRLFEAGDLEGANNILDFAEIENDYLRDIAIMEANIKKRSEVFIRETKTKIDILATMIKLSTRFTEIEELYDKIVAVVFKYNIEIDTLFYYVEFLYEQNQYQKAYEIGKRLEVLVSDSTDDEKKARLYGWLGLICSDLVGKKTEAEEYYKKTITIIESLVVTNPQLFNFYLATNCNNAGIFYKNHGQVKKAEMYCKKALVIFEELVAVNPEMFNPDLADSYNNVALFFDAHGQSKKAEEYYKKALAIYEKLAESNAERFNPYLATSYNNVGVFYSKQGEKEKAEEYYKKAISIREKLAGSNPEKFTPDLADVYDNTGLFYVEQGQSEKAEKYYKKAISIRAKLVELSPESYSADLAMSYNNAGNFYENQGDSRIAEDYHKKAIAIREMLAESNPEIFNSDLADSYNNIGAFYYNQGQQEKAKKYLKQAIELYKKLAESNFERFNPVLAVGYFNYAIFSQEEIWLEKALVLAKTMPDNSYCKQIIDALQDKKEI